MQVVQQKNLSVRHNLCLIPIKLKNDGRNNRHLLEMTDTKYAFAKAPLVLPRFPFDIAAGFRDLRFFRNYSTPGD